MKASLPQETRKEDDDQDDQDPTPTQVPVRPSLLKSPPGRLSDLSQKLRQNGHDEPEDDSTGSSDDAEEFKQPSVGVESAIKAVEGKENTSSPDEEQITRLKDAMNAKLLKQQRMRRGNGSSSRPDSSSARVSPIQEEKSASISPSLDAKVESDNVPMRTNSTVSTESTDSTKTVRASKPATPAANLPPRTPSYPFPYVSGTPKGWPQNVHQPFTALSPTVGDTGGGEDDTPGRSSVSMLSGGSTPAANTDAFMPPGTFFQSSDDARFPTPNLYDMVLQLNAEPGLEQWWATVTNLIHDHFKADRMTLVMPQDPTDIENAPWGQKATFSMNGPEEFVPHRTVLDQLSNAAARPKTALRPDFASRQPSVDDVKPQKLHPERLRPRLEARHSYAGHGRETKETFNDASVRPPTRPAGPQRTATHAAGMTASVGHGRLPAQRQPSSSTLRYGSLSDPDFSSIAGGVDAGPYAEVFSTSRTLDHEVRPLIEPGGVNRVLERGRVVTVTRDYVSENSASANNGNTPTAQEEPAIKDSKPSAAPKSNIGSFFGNYRSIFASDNAPSMLRDYEEYEQYPASPWSQSPAPSPAIQADEENNPFFASENQHVEDSFNPAASPKDYSQYGQVEAIGVENASTVIHIPLVHPTISQPMQSLKTYPQSEKAPGVSRRSNTLDTERKAPIAILSVLTSTVPYPHNLIQSLKLLGPHLATSFSISMQFSSTHSQAVAIRHRRTATGQSIINAPMTIEPASLEDMIKADAGGPPGSISDSVTSPSDYSGRSKYSPTSSIVGTPGWDASIHGWGTTKPMTGTPGATASETFDNYFEAKRRSGHRSASNANVATQSTSARPKGKIANPESKQGAREMSSPDDGSKAHLSDRQSRPVTSSTQERSPILQFTAKEHSPSRAAVPSSPQRPHMRHSVSHASDWDADRLHSQLHSYGADFQASFGGLPSASSFEPQTESGPGHSRKSSYPEEMPPPSERLLRTMIDSVPVQIFTAEPETGRLTWVNSKFMIYRGHEARQVLSEPWRAIHPDDRGEFMATWYRSLRTTQQLQQKVRLQRFDGSYRWFYVRAAPLRDKRQKIVHWIGTMMDFHEQHTAEVNAARQQETAASEAKYRALANSSPQIVFAANKTRGVTFCNTRWVYYSGQPEAQALGVGFMDHVHPDDLVKCKLPTFDAGSDLPKNVPQSVPPEIQRKSSTSAASSSGSSETEKGATSSESSPLTAHMPQRKLSELASTGILRVSQDVDGRPSYSTEVRLKSRDGEYRWHLVRILLAEPLLQSDEEDTWYGTCTDINDHKALERDLKETMDEKSRFLSNMSHEIRTPLNGITGMVNFLIDSSLTTEQMEHVSIIRASTEGLRGLINDILDLSKAEAGMIQLNMDWLYVRALIEEVNDLTSAMAIDKGLELNYLVEEDVPAQVKGDRFRIRQILLNIIGNAIKFTQKGEVFVRCSTHKSDNYDLAEDEAFIKFEIIDTGCGFTDKEAEALFKRFSQIDGSSTRQHGGSGLGLVISRQLAQLHGGHMSARGVPGKGATFMVSIKTTLPSGSQETPVPLPSPGGVNIPILPISPGPLASPSGLPKFAKTPSVPMSGNAQAKASPKYAFEHTQSPSPYTPPTDVGRESPSVSSASSDPSLRSTTRTGSLRSERSSASSFVPETSGQNPPINLSLPNDPKQKSAPLNESQLSISETADSLSTDSAAHIKFANPLKDSSANLATPGGSLIPPMYSILVLCPLKYSREATVHHIDKTLPKNVPHQITAKETLLDCQEMIGGEAPVIFTHIVVVLQDVGEITSLMDQVLSSPPHQSTSIVIITDLAQKKKIMKQAPKYNYDELSSERRIRFVFKPLKPSRFATIFDPQKEREMSTDRNQDSAQQVALTQKQVFEELTKRLGNKDKHVLLVEDNKTNQLVVQKFLKKVSIETEIVVDGVECTDQVFSHPHGYYSIILCDLHMPNKDGYQTCKEIRQWERANKYAHLPIVALSANVLGDVSQKCVASGFNSYLSKPVDFKELSTVLMTFMDPSDPSKPHEFMKAKRRQSLMQGR